MVSPGLLRLILALSAKGDRIAVYCDFQVVILHAGQFGGDDDPVLMSIDVDCREAGSRCSRALSEPINLLLEEAHVAEWAAIGMFVTIGVSLLISRR